MNIDDSSVHLHQISLYQLVYVVVIVLVNWNKSILASESVNFVKEEKSEERKKKPLEKKNKHTLHIKNKNINQDVNNLLHLLCVITNFYIITIA